MRSPVPCATRASKLAVHLFLLIFFQKNLESLVAALRCLNGDIRDPGGYYLNRTKVFLIILLIIYDHVHNDDSQNVIQSWMTALVRAQTVKTTNKANSEEMMQLRWTYSEEKRHRIPSINRLTGNVEGKKDRGRQRQMFLGWTDKF